MQFKKAQRIELARAWKPGSWFYETLGEPARQIVETAYGLRAAPAAQRTKCQEDVTLALALFADRIGCDKSHATHALLTGSIAHLIRAIEKGHATEVKTTKLEKAWQDCFRDINMGALNPD